MCEYLFKIFERTLNNCIFYLSCHKWEFLLNEVGVLRGISYCISDDISVVCDFLGNDYYFEFLFYCAVGDKLKNDYFYFVNSSNVDQDLFSLRRTLLHEKEDPK